MDWRAQVRTQLKACQEAAQTAAAAKAGCRSAAFDPATVPRKALQAKKRRPLLMQVAPPAVLKAYSYCGISMAKMRTGYTKIDLSGHD